MYTKHDQDSLRIVIIWVDDILIAASNKDIFAQFKEMMKGEFKMKDLGEISYFLSITFDQRPNEISMDQTRFIIKLLEKFSMSVYKNRSTPCEQKPGDFDNNKKSTLKDTERSLVAYFILPWVLDQILLG